MDALKGFLEDVRTNGYAAGNFLGFLHVMIGRRITTAEGGVISPGLSWRELANLLKKLRWDTDIVGELGLNPDKLAPKDREKLWYVAISRAGVASDKAAKAGDQFAKVLAKHHFIVSERPGKSQ